MGEPAEDSTIPGAGEGDYFPPLWAPIGPSPAPLKRTRRRHAHMFKRAMADDNSLRSTDEDSVSPPLSPSAKRARRPPARGASDRRQAVAEDTASTSSLQSTSVAAGVLAAAMASPSPPADPIAARRNEAAGENNSAVSLVGRSPSPVEPQESKETMPADRSGPHGGPGITEQWVIDEGEDHTNPDGDHGMSPQSRSAAMSTALGPPKRLGYSFQGLSTIVTSGPCCWQHAWGGYRYVERHVEQERNETRSWWYGGDVHHRQRDKTPDDGLDCYA